MVNVREKKNRQKKKKKEKLVSSLTYGKNILALALKIYTNTDIKVPRSSVNLLNFLILLKVFCTGL